MQLKGWFSFILILIVCISIEPVLVGQSRRKPNYQPIKPIEPLKFEKKIEPSNSPEILLSGMEPKAAAQNSQNGPDIGVDYVVVTSLRVNLREAPDVRSRVLLTVPQGDLLVMLKAVAFTSWYNVIHVKTNQEGWVHASTVTVRRTQNQKPKITIPGTEISGHGNPSLAVTNETELALTLKIGEVRWVFSPKETKTIELVPGQYGFFASAPGVIPDFGDQLFQSGYGYTWRFYIEYKLR